MLRAFVALLLVALSSSPGSAQGRLALLIGNQGYNAKVGPLTNPHNDIALIGAALQKLGFKTTLVKDADYRSIDAAIKRHIANVRREGPGAISFVYYSGHGAADPDTKINYLIPVDVAQADDEELWNFSLNLNTVIENLRAQAPQATHYVVFDACRNELNLTRKGRKALADKGFAPIAYTPGVMVAYAPGKTADDRGAGSGPYARALAEEIVQPGIEALTMFRRVALRVNRDVGQDPWMSASTLPEIYFAGRATARPEFTEAERTWGQVKDTTNQAVLEAFVRQFGDSVYGALARARLEELKKSQVAIAPPAPSPKSVAPPPQAKTAPVTPQPKAAPAPSATVKFNKVYGQGWFDAVVLMPDGGFVVAGREVELTAEGHAKLRLARVMRLDRAGNQVWNKVFGSGTDTRWARTAQLLADGNVLVTGFKGINTTLEWIVQLDGKGNVISEKSFGETRKDFQRSVVPLTGGRYAVVGDNFINTGTPNLRAFLVDGAGATLAEHQVKDHAMDCGSVALAMADGGFVVATENFKPAQQAMNTGRFLRFDRHGALVYDKLIGAAPQPCPSAIVGTPDEGVAISGLLGNEKEMVAWVARVRGDGSLLWEQRYGPAAERLALPAALAAGPDGGLAIAGCIDTKGGFAADETHGWVLTVDAQGKPVWEGVFPGQIGGMGRAIAVLPDGGLVVAGARDRGCVEITGLQDGGNAWVFTVTPEEMRRK